MLQARTRGGEEGPRLDQTGETLHNSRVWFLYIQGFTSHSAELTARLRLETVPPLLVCLTETWLTRAVEEPRLEGYILVARRDRKDGRQGGGVAAFVHESYHSSATKLGESSLDERIWLMLHTDEGPFLGSVWYRPPGDNRCPSIDRFSEELSQYRQDAIGTFSGGDFNVHNIRWLKHSTHNSVAGKQLQVVADSAGLRQLVHEPTRGPNLLDLVLSDVGTATTEVLHRVADHSIVSVKLGLTVPASAEIQREVWSFNQADWEGMQEELAAQNWKAMRDMSVDDATAFLTDTILKSCEKHIPKRVLQERKWTHPWLNHRASRLVQARVAAKGTPQEEEAAKACSAGLLNEYNAWVSRTREKLRSLPRMAKAWWRTCRELMQRRQKVCSIPPLKSSSGHMATEPAEKGCSSSKDFLCQKRSIAGADSK